MNAHIPFFVRREGEGETMAAFIARIRAHPPAGPLLEEFSRTDPSKPRGPKRRPAVRRAVEQASSGTEKGEKP